jgi:hypothetical protein
MEAHELILLDRLRVIDERGQHRRAEEQQPAGDEYSTHGRRYVAPRRFRSG